MNCNEAEMPELRSKETFLCSDRQVRLPPARWAQAASLGPTADRSAARIVVLLSCRSSRSPWPETKAGTMGNSNPEQNSTDPGHGVWLQQ